MGLRIQSGLNPVVFIETKLGAARPQKSDLVTGVAFHRTRILQRNERHRDANGRAYSPYSNKGPIYIDAGAGGASRTRQQKVRATQRFARKVGLSGRVQRGGRRKASGSGGERQRRTPSRERGEARFRRIGKGVTPINGITPGGYLKVASYRAYKIKTLGRSGVDLRGARAPHMLGSGVIHFSGEALGSGQSLKVSKGTRGVVQLGIFGPKAAIAQGHHVGAGRLPRRRFLAFGTGDVAAISSTIARLASGRMRAT